LLQITKRVDYALITLTHLALHRHERFSARALADTYTLSRTLTANVLKRLAHGQLIRSIRGSKGGYELAVDPSTVPIGRVIELLEGPLQLAECIGDHPEGMGCSISKVCPVKHSVLKLHMKIRDALYGQTLADLAVDARPTREALPVAESCSALTPKEGSA
jgi:Rrf2 family protein